VRVQRLAGLVLEVAFALRAGHGLGQRRGQRSGFGHVGEQHQQGVGRHASDAGCSGHLGLEVHNSSEFNKARMLFDSTVRKELARGFGATLVVILTIVLTNALIRTVGQAASGAVAPQDVVLLLGYVTLGQLPTLLALSLFVAVVVALGRMYRDSEMIIWFASGVGIGRFVRPVLRTAWPVLLVVALLVLFVWPWGNRAASSCASATSSGATWRVWRPACSRARATAAACCSWSAKAPRAAMPAMSSSSRATTIPRR
jgi:hypothetical protein